MHQLADSELILNNGNKVYHLDLDGKDVADDVILVGDQDRVAVISQHFEKITFRAAHREFITHTGIFKGKRLTVMSTGIGTDNIDIVVNELDAAVNFDLVNRTEKKVKRQLNLIRLGTCGALQPETEINAIICSTHGLGLDGMLHYYEDVKQVDEKKITDAFIRHCQWSSFLPHPYCVSADSGLVSKLGEGAIPGITATAPGFYAPQGRQLRLKTAVPQLNARLAEFRHEDLKIQNFEMETSALYGLGKLLGHRCVTLCVVIANRARKEFSEDIGQSVEQLINYSLTKIAA
jgi:uridine phosphorylase